MTTVQVETAVVGRKRSGPTDHGLVIGLLPGPTSLRDLLEAIVRAEVAAFLARTGDESVVRVLTQETLAQGLAAGSVRSGGRDVAADVDADDAVASAIEAQQDGLFQAIIDDKPVDGLDDVIELADGTRVMFLRLVPLVGG